MSKSIKFNVHDIFMEGQNTVENRNLFVSSPLFPVFVALYNRAAGRVKVGLLKTRQAAGGKNYITEVPIVSQIGLKIASINNSNSTYDGLSFVVMWQPFQKHGIGMLNTTNPKYMQSRLSAKSRHDAAIDFDNRLGATLNAIDYAIKSMVGTAIDKKFGRNISSAPAFGRYADLSSSLVTFLARYFVGEVGQSELDSNNRTEFERLFNEYCANREKFKVSLADTRDMLSTEKWVYITDANGGVILGAIRPEPLCAAVDQYMLSGSLPMDANYVAESVPFKWYPSFDDIPEDYRKSLTFSMVMLKAHTGSAEMLPTEEGCNFYYELGAFYECRDGAPSVYVLTK